MVLPKSKAEETEYERPGLVRPDSRAFASDSGSSFSRDSLPDERFERDEAMEERLLDAEGEDDAKEASSRESRGG